MGNRVFCCGRVCPKVALYPPGEHDFFEDPHACDPAGAVFQETLEDLNEVDRLLLFFASSSNIAAVRWLMLLGANIDACDTNGTTCLHASCRSGSLAIVREFIESGLPIGATDSAGWTVLHVAVFMGRRAVTVHLMQRGAELRRQNQRGLTPCDLCSDSWLREVMNDYASHRHLHGSTPWFFTREHEFGEDNQISSRLRFEPFFVPRAPVSRETSARHPLLQVLGIEIFNKRPGQGLAYLVATGCVRDFPIELSSFLMEHEVSLAQVGEFLGEDFSLSQTLRLEFINSVRLTGTGVVSCLFKVFKQFHIPSDFQKIDRLVDGVAQIWWRQHELTQDIPQVTSKAGDGEVEGMALMQILENYSCLHHLMFSTVLLHWNLYAPLPPSQRVTRERWLAINAGITGDEDADSASGPMRRVNLAIYNLISKAFIPHLQIWSSRGDGDGAAEQASSQLPRGGGATTMGPPCYRTLTSQSNGVESQGHVDGLVRLVGGGFPSPAGVQGTVTYKHMRSILSETTSTAVGVATPANSRPEPAQGRSESQEESLIEAPLSVVCRQRENGNTCQEMPFSDVYEEGSLFSGCRAGTAFRGLDGGGHGPSSGSGHDRLWLSLREGHLFLAPKAREWAPYAFLQVDDGVAYSADELSLTLTLTPSRDRYMRNEVFDEEGGVSERSIGGFTERMADVAEGEQNTSQISLIFLLPDGRWQVLEVPRFQVQVSDVQQLGHWALHLSQYCKQASQPKLNQRGRGDPSSGKREFGSPLGHSSSV
eukprot:TRINITY_DN55105_c0_g1_i1.p1 TRINITY_DN55105_c0_g1~~TRINITY_DN55105_c0_g1_i1.p1  ORF type:complete len:765 (+),score=81.94 TRINITY_DN55105_c0_g1_i1:178-2472(+)